MTDQDHKAVDAKHPSKGIDATKKRLADEKTARDKKQAEQRGVMDGVKPTPTQEENDLSASGEHVTEHEADGSPPDPNVAQPAPPPTEGEGGDAGATKAREARPAAPNQRGDYATRAAAPAKHE
jgi:hypothetical protein